MKKQKCERLWHGLWAFIFKDFYKEKGPKKERKGGPNGCMWWKI